MKDYRELRNEIGKILIANNLRTDQVGIGALARLVEEARLEGKKEVLREVISDINYLKNNSEGSVDWFNGLRTARSVPETKLDGLESVEINIKE